MHDPATTPDPARESLDRFALDLQRLRDSSGLSYAEVAAAVFELRRSRGLHDAAARVPRSTIYSCFSTGRSRIKADLLRDIVHVLTGDETETAQWLDRYAVARSAPKPEQQAPVQPPKPLSTIEPATPPITATPDLPKRTSLWMFALVFVACIVLNRLGLAVNTSLSLGLFLDMIGTCVASMLLGPWVGVAVAIASSGLVFLNYPDVGALFVLVNVTGALIWGYGVRQFKMGNSLARFTVLGICAAIACSTVGVPIGLILASIDAGSSIEDSIHQLESLGLPFALSLFFANIVISLCDKLLASFIALICCVALVRQHWFSGRHMPLVEHLAALRCSAEERPGLDSSNGRLLTSSRSKPTRTFALGR